MKRKARKAAAIPAPAERRGARRVFTSRSARILDVSPGGLRLETAVPLEKDRVYDLIIRVDDRRIPVAARVLRVRRFGETVRANMVYERIFETDRDYLDQVLVREVAERMTVVVR